MANSKTVRVGLIGAGGIMKQRHLPGLRAMEGVELVAVCNRSEASGRAVADTWGIATVETNWRKLVARDDIDAVLIGTWPYMHRQMSVAALAAGKHVFCQARMAGNLADAKAMVAAADARPELVNMICPPPHRMPWEPWIRQMIAGEELGEIWSVRLVSVNDSNANPNTITWREQVEYSGKQALQVGIWAETLIAWVGEYETLEATTATPVTTKRDATGNQHTIGIPQIVLVQGTLANGAAISEQHSGLSLHEQANYVVIEGEKATLRVDAMEKVSFGRQGEKLEAANVPKELTRGWQVEADFIGAVRAAMDGVPANQRVVSPDFREGLKYMKKVEAVDLSAREGRAVRLAEL